MQAQHERAVVRARLEEGETDPVCFELPLTDVAGRTSRGHEIVVTPYAPVVLEATVKVPVSDV